MQRVAHRVSDRIAELEAENEKLSGRLIKAMADASRSDQDAALLRRHVGLLAKILAEIKASHEGQSDQPIGDILTGGLLELNELHGLS